MINFPQKFQIFCAYNRRNYFSPFLHFFCHLLSPSSPHHLSPFSPPQSYPISTVSTYLLPHNIFYCNIHPLTHSLSLSRDLYLPPLSYPYSLLTSYSLLYFTIILISFQFYSNHSYPLVCNVMRNVVVPSTARNFYSGPFSPILTLRSIP